MDERRESREKRLTMGREGRGREEEGGEERGDV